MLPNITYLNIARERSHPRLADYDAVYICGGNTYFILNRLRKTGLASSLKRYVLSGGLYIGVSAGSIIAGQDISIAGWGSEGDPNDIKLKNLSGLRLTNITIFPHYKANLRNEIEEFKKTVNSPVEVIKDKEAIVIKDNFKRKIKLKN